MVVGASPYSHLMYKCRFLKENSPFSNFRLPLGNIPINYNRLSLSSNDCPIDFQLGWRSPSCLPTSLARTKGIPDLRSSVESYHLTILRKPHLWGNCLRYLEHQRRVYIGVPMEVSTRSYSLFHQHYAYDACHTDTHRYQSSSWQHPLSTLTRC